MRILSQIIFLLIVFACSPNGTDLVEGGKATFRISLNYGRELTDAELDSIGKSHPLFIETTKENRFYDLLVRKGIVSDHSLDTSGFNFSAIALEEPTVSFDDMAVRVDTARGREYLIVMYLNKTMSVDLGPLLLGNRFLSYIDIDSNGKRDVLLLEKSYVIGGYNFDLKFLEFN